MREFTLKNETRAYQSLPHCDLINKYIENCTKADLPKSMTARRRIVLLYSDLILHHGSVSDTLGRASKNRMYSLPLLDLESIWSSFTRVRSGEGIVRGDG